MTATRSSEKGETTMRRSMVVALALVLSIPMAWSGELAGVTMPDQVTVGDAKLELNGMGLRKKLWVKVYVAGLWLERTSHDPAAIVASSTPKRVVMHFLTDRATKGKMDDAWDEGFEANSPGQVASLRDRIERFKSFFGDMKDGDVVEYVMVPGEGTTIKLNGALKGTIEGDDFQAALLRVWLGEHPPTDDLKAGMLGE